MSESRELSALKAAYREWGESKGEATQAWLSLMADEVRIRSAGEGHAGMDFAGDCHSRQDAVSYFTALLRDWKMIHWTPENFVDDGARIAMFGRCAWTFKKNGVNVEVDIAHLWRFENGKAVELLEVFDSAKVVAAASQ